MSKEFPTACLDITQRCFHCDVNFMANGFSSCGTLHNDYITILHGRTLKSYSQTLIYLASRLVRVGFSPGLPVDCVCGQFSAFLKKVLNLKKKICILKKEQEKVCVSLSLSRNVQFYLSKYSVLFPDRQLGPAREPPSAESQEWGLMGGTRER